MVGVVGGGDDRRGMQSETAEGRSRQGTERGSEWAGGREREGDQAGSRILRSAAGIKPRRSLSPLGRWDGGVGEWGG